MKALLAQATGMRSPQLLHSYLRSVREHLDMEVAFVSRFEGGRRHFREIDSGFGDFEPIQVGDSDPLDQSYCQRVVDGRLPELIPDAAELEEARGLPATQALPVGAHLSVPIQLADGSVYGTFCCFSRRPDHSLGERDLRIMRVFAELVAEQVNRERRESEREVNAHALVDAALRPDGMLMHFQPICEVRDGRVVGYEALARFIGVPASRPDAAFAEADYIDRGAELELHAIALALEALPLLPEPLYLSINASPATLTHPGLAPLFAGLPLQRLVLEVTEHAAVEHYDRLLAAIRPLQAGGLHLAIDDAGAGYASFRHVLNLAPHQIKLDISLTRDLHRDRSRYALAAALGGFGRAIGCQLVAEGVESELELAALRELGIQRAQGYHLGRPAPLAEQLARL
jgi:EAL domain-containing protein (putative c-di-GMP-specific phosphodiesterase class I)